MDKYDWSTKSNSRYDRVAFVDIKKVCLDCPVDIEKGAILFDRKLKSNLLQLKLINIGDQPIKSAYIRIYCYDDSGDKIALENDYLEYAYVDVHCPSQGTFGTKTPIYLPSTFARVFFIYITRVVLQDESVVRFDEEDHIDVPILDKIEGNIENTDELFRIEEAVSLNNEAYPLTYIPRDYSNSLWSCTCGRINSKDTESCMRCSRSKKLQFDIINDQYLQKSMDEYQKYLDEKRMEEEIQKQIKREQKLKRNKKILKFSFGFIILSLVICIGIFVGSSVRTMVREQRYREEIYQLASENLKVAEKLLRSKDPNNLTSIYYDLLDITEFREDGLLYEYKDSTNMLNKMNALREECIALIKSTWIDIDKAIPISNRGILALKKDGTILVDDSHYYSWLDVSELDWTEDIWISGWKDIADIAAGAYTEIIAVKQDGTVLVTDLYNNETDDPDLEQITGWKDIKSIYYSRDFGYLGIKKDGTVIMTDPHEEVEEWKDIVKITTTTDYIVGLTSQGRVMVAGRGRYYEDSMGTKISDLEDIVDIAGGYFLKKDGTVTVLADSRNIYPDVSSWSNVVQIAWTGKSLFGLKDDGTVIVANSEDINYTEYDEEELARLRDIVSISAADSSWLYSGFVGVKRDGTVVFYGLYMPGYR